MSRRPKRSPGQPKGVPRRPRVPLDNRRGPGRPKTASGRPRTPRDVPRRLKIAPRRPQTPQHPPSHVQGASRRLQDAILMSFRSQSGSKLASESHPESIFCENHVKNIFQSNKKLSTKNSYLWDILYRFFIFFSEIWSLK